MSSLAKLRFQIQELQEQKAKLEKQLVEANKQYKVGLWGVLIGIFLLPLYGIGLLLLLAGGLAALTNRSKRSNIQKEIERIEKQIRVLRQKVVEIESKESSQVQP